jgi:hypothetical protein
MKASVGRLGSAGAASLSVTGARLSGGAPLGVAQRGCSSRCDDAHHVIVQAARLDVAQRAWNLRCDDEHHVKDAGLDRDHVLQLESWIEWQRRYDATPL